MLVGLGKEWDIYSVHDPKIPILGVGEATSTNTPYQLFKGTDFILARDGHYIDATLKHSVRYTNWRDEAFHSWITPPGYAIHFNNTKLKDFVFMRLKERHPDNFYTIEGTVDYWRNMGTYAEISINNETSTYDYIIDCSGFPKDYSDYTMVDLPINHALVTPINEPGTWNYTHHWAHKHGWMFGIPLSTRQGWGYMYNDEITSKEDAIEDMCSILKIDKEGFAPREYIFKPYYTVKGLINGRVLKNGNRYMFFEPMEAMSMEYYTMLNLRYIMWIQGSLSKEELERVCTFDVLSLINFYRFVYHGGSTYDTDFWNIQKKKCAEYLNEDQLFQGMLKYWHEQKDYPNASFELILQPFPAHVWKQFNAGLGYNYF